LQKVLAAAGIASRRECEELIREGRVEVDGELVTKLGTKADPQENEIRLDGQLLPKVAHLYFLVNKPKGVVSTNRDPAGRPRVIDLVPPQAGRVFTVGRLDIESEGLMLLTNDGELANRLAHPRYGVDKKYRVQVAGTPGREVIAKLRQGVRVAEGTVRAEWVTIKRKQKQSTIIELVLREGKNREIRRMLAALGHKVQRLRRVAIGDVVLGKLPLGEFREATAGELRALRKAAQFKSPRKKGTGRRQ
jgi:23S rRNA pseudouridine2605 synthase